jgi:hypothetical protein
MTDLTEKSWYTYETLRSLEHQNKLDTFVHMSAILY